MLIPEQALGGDLIWWRESPSCHTAVTVWGGGTELSMLGPQAQNESEIIFRLYTSSGKPCTEWTQTLQAGVPLTVRSEDHAGFIDEGVLGIFPTARIAPQKDASWNYRRFLSMVDWYSDAGDLVSLHSDHSVSSHTRPIEYTEVVFRETPEQRTFLVLLNGPEYQEARSVTLEIRNHAGRVMQAVYTPAMQPFSLHKLNLRELFPDLCEFCEGQHATLEGKFDCHHVFGRPYVMTEGRHLAGYHGGDRYHWKGIPRFLYKAMGRGEVNPMVAIHSDVLTTTVNLLNSHGDLDDDFWVDARLYDESGEEIAHRERWLLARRGDLSRGEIADLLGGDRAFKGHIALSFSDDAKPFYPRRLQALMEYRSSVSTARVMAWSDIWNGRASMRRIRNRFAGFFPVADFYGENYLDAPDVAYRCHYRIWASPLIISTVSITNSGMERDYRESVEYAIRLFNSQGEMIEFAGKLAPQATDFGTINRFFPAAQEFLGPTGVGVASVESTADLAVMHFSHHQTSGAVSAEHFLASATYRDGKKFTCCGA